jgi:hypothetical protein
MSETLSLAFAFAWLFAMPPVQSQDTAPNVPSFADKVRNSSAEKFLPLRP